MPIVRSVAYKRKLQAQTLENYHRTKSEEYALAIALPPLPSEVKRKAETQKAKEAV